MKRTACMILLTLTLHAHATEWYEALRPGITRSEVLDLAGPPSDSTGNTDIYTRIQGHLEVVYQSNTLQECTYYNTPDGAVSWCTYATLGGDPDQEVEQRRSYLRSRQFHRLPNFQGQSVYTHKYSGMCYKVNDSFIVVEPIITLLGGLGWFANFAARVLLLTPDGREECLYSAMDNWPNLRPPQLTVHIISERMNALLAMTNNIADKRVLDALGEPDSHMGSGIDYSLFYLSNALAVVATSFDQPTIEFIRPGRDILTFDQWKSITQQSASGYREAATGLTQPRP